MSEQDKSALDGKDTNKRKLALQAKFNQRITIAKHGREKFLNKDYIEAAKKYNEYLSILAQAQDIEDIYDLSPAKFNPNSDLTEMLLISHVYWELARIYEMTPKLQNTFEKCIKQFVRFTVNQPYQVLNSEVLRKYIKKNKKLSKQTPAFEKAYSQIQIESKKCFVAGFAFGEKHWVTNELRKLKSDHLNRRFGVAFTSMYYRSSDPLVRWLDKRKFIGSIIKGLSRPVLALIAAIARAKRKF